MAWLAGFSHRALIPCAHTDAGAQTDYTKKVRIFKTTGTNEVIQAEGQDYVKVYLNNHALNWPYDIKFTNSAGTTLNYYRDEYDADDGTWRVKLDSIPADVTTDFYIYYGYTGYADSSDGPNTFNLWFDDFETNNLTKWGSIGASWSTQGTVKKEKDYTAYAVTSASSNDLIGNVHVVTTSIMVRGFVYMSTTTGSCYQVTPWSSSGYRVYALMASGGEFLYYNGTDWLVISTYVATTWYEFEVALDLTNSVIRWWINGISKTIADPTLKDSNKTTLVAPTHSWDDPARLASSQTGVNMYIDQYWARKYVYPEPIWATPGAEESLGKVGLVGTGSIGSNLISKGLIN